MVTCRSWRRSASVQIGAHTTGATEPLSHTQGTIDFNPSIFIELWRSDMPIHSHIMHHTEANKSHKLTTTGHCHFQ